MKLAIERIRDASRSEWQECWLGCESATYFQSPEWAELWSAYRAGGVRPSAKLIEFSDGARAVMPLSFETKHGGLLNRFVSSPEGTYGGWLASSPLTLEHAMLLVDWLTRRQHSSLVWRLNPYDRLVFEAGISLGVRCKSDETHAIRLSKSPDEILKSFKPPYRSQIRKAAASGRFEIAPATSLEDWRAYFGVYQDSLRRWGDTAEDGYEWRLFEAMYRLGSPNIVLWLARYDGQVVSGDICVYSKAHAAYWHGSTLADHLRTGAAKLLKFEVIKAAHAAGHAWYDFNPSAGLEGVKFFKEGFNAEVLPAPIVYVDTTFKRVVRAVAAAAHLSYAQLSLQPLQEIGLPPIFFGL